LLCFSTGQILSFGMILLALVWALIASRLPDREPVRVYSERAETGTGDEEKKQARKNRRKMKKEIGHKK
jgi:hypothetical protein